MFPLVLPLFARVVDEQTQRDEVDSAMEVLTMLEGHEARNGNSKDHSKLRFRSYQPVIRGLVRKGDMEAVMKLWKHMKWHNVLPKV